MFGDSQVVARVARTVKTQEMDAGPLAQSVELCTYEVNSRYARVPSSILGGSMVFFFRSSSSSTYKIKGHTTHNSTNPSKGKEIITVGKVHNKNKRDSGVPV